MSFEKHFNKTHHHNIFYFAKIQRIEDVSKKILIPIRNEAKDKNVPSFVEKRKKSLFVMMQFLFDD